MSLNVKAGGCKFTIIRDINDKEHCREYVIIKCADISDKKRIKPEDYSSLFAIVGETIRYKDNMGLFIYFTSSNFRVIVKGIDVVVKGVDEYE